MSKSLSRYHARKLWERHHNVKIPTGMHLHHIDGNAFNNKISNLVVCTPNEHIEFHRKLGHSIQDNFIGKADFFAEMSKEEQNNFRLKASEYSKRRTNLTRSFDSRLKQKLSCQYQSNSLEMIDLKTDKIINEFSSVKEAAEALGMQRAHIRRVITGERKSWRGYVFRYKKYRNPGHI